MSDTHEQIRRFMIAFNKIDDLYLKAVKRMGVKSGRFVLFYAIADGRVYSQKQICDDWSLPRTTLNSIVRDCVRDGLVRLVPRGNKEKDILLTDEGRALVERIFSPLFAAEAKAMKPFLASGILPTMESMAKRFQESFSKINQ